MKAAETFIWKLFSVVVCCAYCGTLNKAHTKFLVAVWRYKRVHLSMIHVYEVGRANTVSPTHSSRWFNIVLCYPLTCISPFSPGGGGWGGALGFRQVSAEQHSSSSTMYSVSVAFWCVCVCMVCVYVWVCVCMCVCACVCMVCVCACVVCACVCACVCVRVHVKGIAPQHHDHTDLLVCFLLEVDDSTPAKVLFMFNPSQSACLQKRHCILGLCDEHLGRYTQIWA